MNSPIVHPISTVRTTHPTNYPIHRVHHNVGCAKITLIRKVRHARCEASTPGVHHAANALGVHQHVGCALGTKTSTMQRAYQKVVGFSYVEVLVATFLIAIVLVPALDTLQSGIQGSGIHASRAEDHYHITGKVEEVLARPFDELGQEADAAGSPTVIVHAYSDSAGTDARRLVYLSRFDADNADADNDPFTGTDGGVIWVQVQIENTNDTIETLTVQ